MTEQDVEKVNQPDPEDDPTSCSICGHPLGLTKRIDGEELCDGCQREYGDKPEVEACVHCGRRTPGEQMEAFDASAPDEYYPVIRYLCRDCSGGEAGE